MMKNVVYIIFCFALTGCIGKSPQNNRQNSKDIPASIKENKVSHTKDGMIEIDLKKKYPKKDFYLQELGDVEYIALETRSDVLLGRGALKAGTFVSDSLIVVFNSGGDVFVFNHQGKNLYAFNHVGRSGEEYKKIGDMAVDFDRREIFIRDFWMNAKICVYSFDGTFKRVLKLPYKYWIFGMLNYDSEFLLSFEDHEWGDTKEVINHHPYALISKRDGTLKPLEINFKERVSKIIYLAQSNTFLGWITYPLIKNGEEFLISDFASDTVYRLEENGLVPFLLKQPAGIWKSTPPVIGYVTLKTNRYTFVAFVEMQVTASGKDAMYKQFVYDSSTGEVYEYKLFNRDYEPAQELELTNFCCDLPANYARSRLLPTALLEDYQAGKLKGKLKEVTSHLQEDANPVLMLVKFRD